MSDGNVLNIQEFPISDGPTTFRWDGYDKPVYHYKFSISKDFEFSVTLVSNTTMIDKASDMEKHAGAIAKARAAETTKSLLMMDSAIFTNVDLLVQLPFFRTMLAPFDMLVPQCWLLLELDKDIPWEWMRDRPVVTAKHPDPVYVSSHVPPKVYHNVWLRHVYDDATVEADPARRPNDSCHFAFFGVVHRTGEDSNPPAYGSHLMNFRLQFLRQGMKPLPMPADPDVGNEGHDEFPSPP